MVGFYTSGLGDPRENPMNAEEYMKDRIEDQLAWYDSKSGQNQRWFKRLRLAEMAAAATIPLLAGYISVDRPFLPPLVGILGAMVALIAGALGLYQFENHWIEYRTTSESLKKEKFLFLTGSEPFDKAPDENYQLLVQRIETLISKENTNWAQPTSMKPSEEGNTG